MRVAIPTLPSPESLALKVMLEKAGYLIVTEFPSYTVRVERGDHPWIVVDVPDAVFGRLLTHRIGELAPWDGVFVKAHGGNLNDKAAVIEIPDDDAKALEAVCTGTMRALDQIQKVTTEPARVAAQPFLNASELLANAVDTLSARIAAASTTVTNEVTQVVSSTSTVTQKELQELQRLQREQASKAYSQGQHVVSEVIRARQGLFDELMKYLTRPRWWQYRYWFPAK